MTKSAEYQAISFESLAEGCSDWRAENRVADCERELKLWITRTEEQVQVMRLLRRIPRSDAARYQFVQSLLDQMKGSSLSRGAFNFIVIQGDLESALREVRANTESWKRWDGSYSPSLDEVRKMRRRCR